MKNLLLIICLGSFSLQAQFDPLSQYLNTAFIPNFAPYDSMTVSSDTGAAFSKEACAWQHYFTNGKIDTLTIQAQNVNAVAYKGEVMGRITEVTGFDITGTTPDSIDRVVYMEDQYGRDSVLESYYYNNGFNMNFQARSTYNPDSTLSKMDIYAPVGPTMMKVGDWSFFYNQGLTDSIYYTISPSGGSDGFYKFYYSASTPGRIQKMEVYEDLDNDGERDLMQLFFFGHNASNQVNRIIQLDANPNTLNMDLTGEIRYDIHSKSTISLPEVIDVRVEIYPNPASDFVRVQEHRKFSSYRIVDITGQLMQEGDMAQEIDINRLPEGNYILSLSGATGDVSTIFMKK